MIVFDTHGDQWSGLYVGKEDIDAGEGEYFTRLNFRSPASGEYYGINAGFKLLQAFEKVSPGTLVRITYVKDVDTGQPSPMKDFRVEVASA